MLYDFVTVLNDMMSNFWTIVLLVFGFWLLVVIGSMLRLGPRRTSRSEDSVRLYRLPGRGGRGD